MQVVRAAGFYSVVSGGRVSNAWVTYPEEGDNPGKLGLVPHVDPPLGVCPKGFARFRMGPRPIS